MTAPRDFADWIRLVERNQVALRGISGTITDAVAAVVVDQAAKDARHPTAPIELVYQTGLYTDTSGRTRVRFILDFPDVIKATDGTDITVTAYELWGQDVSATALDISTSAVTGLAVPGLTLPGLAATPATKAVEATHIKAYALADTSATSAFRTDGFLAGSIWLFQARAIGPTLTPGEFSIEIRVVMEADTTPPPQPTKPVLDIARGTITATWDGLAVTGPMPADFSYAVLAAGSASSPVQEVARFGRDGGFTVTANMPYYTPQFYRIQAVDESGNRGPWSEEAVGYTTPLVDTDVILSTIDGAKTYLKNIDAGVAILPNTIYTKHLVVTEDMTAALAQFLHVKAGMLEANEIWADSAWFGVADAKLVRSEMFIGKSFTGGTFTLTNGGTFQTQVEAYKGLKLTSAGLSAFSSSGVSTFNLDAATGNVNIFGGTFTGGMFATSALPSTGITIDPVGGFRQWDANGALTVQLGGNRGENLLVGNLYTSPENSRGLKLINSSPWGLPALVYSYDGSVTIDQAASFMRYTISGDPELVHRAPNRSIVGGTGVGFVRVEGDFILSLGLNNTQKMRVEQPFHLDAWSPVDGYHAMYLTGKLASITTSAGNITLDSGGYYVMAPGVQNKTTGVAANMYVADDGGLFRSVSAARYKILPREASVPGSLLGVRVKDWIDLAAAEEYSAFYDLPRPLTEQDQARLDALSLKRIPGMIAEEVEAAGGSAFVIYGTDGRIEGLMYDRFNAARTQLLIDGMADFERRIAALESKP